VRTSPLSANGLLLIRSWLVLAGALVLTLFLPVASARAQYDELDDEPDDAAQQQQMNVFMMADENFDQWVFGGGRNSIQGRKRLEALLALQIDQLDRTCALSEAQKKKLQLAGQGDIKRFFVRVEEKRKKFQLVKHDQNKVGEIFQEIQPLQNSLNNGLYGPGSLFAKTVKRTLDADQTAKLAQNEREKKLFRYRAKIDLAVTMLDRAVGLKADQRKQLAKLLLEETHPPERFGQWDYYVVLLQAAELPQEKLKPLFDDVQWRLLNRQLDQAKGMKQFLQQNGFLVAPAAQPPAVDVPKAAPVEIKKK
jgi:hypothetical protein